MYRYTPGQPFIIGPHLKRLLKAFISHKDSLFCYSPAMKDGDSAGGVAARASRALPVRPRRDRPNKKAFKAFKRPSCSPRTVGLPPQNTETQHKSRADADSQ